jgi:phosphatidylglycerol:prolipoprotein diacylglycerol transferase
MYPTLYHAFYDWFGVEWSWAKMLNSFGFFVALAFIAASYTLTLELNRKESLGLIKGGTRKVVVGGAPNMMDIFFSGLMGFVLGWKVIYLLVNSSRLFNGVNSPQHIIFSKSGYPLLGLLVGGGYAYYRYYTEKKKQLPKPEEKIESFSAGEYTGTITFLAAIGGLAGAKLFHLFENPAELREFFTHPSLESFISGLTVYGGLIMGAIVVLSYAKMKKMPLLVLSDSATPGMILAYGIGRMGCHTSGDGDWGIENLSPKPGWLSWLPDWAWSYDYPNNVNRVGELMTSDIYPGYGTHLVPGVFPTPLYEIIAAVAIFIFLWSIRKRVKAAGVITAGYLILNGMERFFIEKIRVNNKFDFLGVQATQAEIIAVLFILGGATLLYFSLRKKTNNSASLS